ncbi:DUF4097 family beta strand repeat-containing protein [Actinocorallia longicatena]|uniref:DUF4097 domain-containing protein n=1 Tax=Actinocorallia longicatena TaxID=111803 RepID=A0ABP6QD42_9ACTN
MRWRIGGAVATVLVLAVGVGSVWMWLLRGSETTSRTLQRAASRLDFDFNDADLVIEPGPPGRIRVERELTWAIEKPEISEVWDGDTLRVKITCRTGVGGGCSAVYRIRIPAETAVNAVTGGGNIKFEDLTGTISARTGSGEIRLANTVGDLTLDNGSGNVRVTGSRSQRVHAVSGAGNVELGFTTAPSSITVKSGAGNIEVQVPPGQDYAVENKIGAGNSSIDVGRDPAALRKILVESGAGDVLVGYATG